MRPGKWKHVLVGLVREVWRGSDVQGRAKPKIPPVTDFVLTLLRQSLPFPWMLSCQKGPLKGSVRTADQGKSLLVQLENKVCTVTELDFDLALQFQKNCNS